ncbi:phospholipase A [Janthinobacterium sp. RB2P8]|uniref:phospholipase A n=1 Tax=Janthinobacterium sp. RB2P8 TaxID=3424191 RepID=UPI003F23AD64
MTIQLRKIILSSLLASPALAMAGELEQQMQRCAVLGDASARLGCFDTLAKAAEKATFAAGGDSATAAVTLAAAAEAAPLTPVSPPGVATPDAVNAAIPAIAQAGAAPPETPISRTQQSWELNDASKRGLFNFRPHRDTYLLLANYSSASNDEPFQDFTPGGVKSQHVELTFQLSFKMKLLEDIAGTPIDMWFGYTQQSFWQAYNRKASSPFRETNYQPELMLVLPINKHFAGVEFNYLNFGLVHQSNGQTSTLSRSWNRVYAELGVEKDNLAVTTRIWHRLDNGKTDNDNIDITDYMGHGDLRVSYRNKGHEYAVTARRNFSKKHGSMQASWAFPLKANLKGYLQLFSGYGQSLIDYNYSQKSIGAGFMVDL